jgi:hypothetical protein
MPRSSPGIHSPGCCAEQALHSTHPLDSYNKAPASTAGPLPAARHTPCLGDPGSSWVGNYIISPGCSSWANPPILDPGNRFSRTAPTRHTRRRLLTHSFLTVSLLPRSYLARGRTLLCDRQPGRTGADFESLQPANTYTATFLNLRTTTPHPCPRVLRALENFRDLERRTNRLHRASQRPLTRLFSVVLTAGACLASSEHLAGLPQRFKPRRPIYFSL